jgi:hypothetical protein
MKASADWQGEDRMDFITRNHVELATEEARASLSDALYCAVSMDKSGWYESIAVLKEGGVSRMYGARSNGVIDVQWFKDTALSVLLLPPSDKENAVDDVDAPLPKPKPKPKPKRKPKKDL